MCAGFKPKNKIVGMSFSGEHQDPGAGALGTDLFYQTQGGLVIHKDKGMVDICSFAFECSKNRQHHINHNEVGWIGENVVQAGLGINKRLNDFQAVLLEQETEKVIH